MSMWTIGMLIWGMIMGAAIGLVVGANKKK
jgi:hypothetical protein